MRLARTLMKTTAVFAASMAPQTTSANQPEIRRSDLQRHDLTAPGWEVIQVRFDFPPEASAPPHTQPGDGIVYVIEGTIEYMIGDRPPFTLTAGGVLFIPAGAVRAARNVGNGNAAELATYIVEKHRPLN